MKQGDFGEVEGGGSSQPLVCLECSTEGLGVDERICVATSQVCRVRGTESPFSKW